MRLGFALALLLAVGCATPTLDATQLGITENEYGLYSRMGNTNKVSHLRTTTSIPCRLNATFGSDLTLDYSVDRRMKLPMVAEWRHPEVPGFRPARARFLPDPFYAVPGSADARMELVVSLDDERDLVEGDYELIFFDPATATVYYRRVFKLEGCS